MSGEYGNSNPADYAWEVNQENIVEGRGLEEISRVGWSRYREAVSQSSYADMVSAQARQIHELENRADQAGIKDAPEWATSQKNAAAAGRAHQLSKQLSEQYGKDSKSNFIAYQSGGKKLMVRGRGIVLDKDGAPMETPVTRVYCSVATQNSPEAFQSLFAHLAEEGVMDNSDLAFNLESFQGDQNKPFENNTLVLYVYGSHPDFMDKIAKALKRAKEDAPQVWDMGPRNTARAKRYMVNDFMIPLDDTTSFVEASNAYSYHQGPRGRMFSEITGEIPGKLLEPEQIAQKLSVYTPQRPGLLDQDKDRRRYMPGLIF